MLRIFVILLVLCSSAFSEESGPGESEHKAEATKGEQKSIGAAQQITAPSNNATPTIINIFSARHAEEKSECTDPKNWKEWGWFVWCRSAEWLDAEKTIAIFTVILGVATGFLWWATRGLVKGGERLEQRQLRAYVSVEPMQVMNFGGKNRLGVMVHLQNHGSTPASEISHEFGMSAFPNPLPVDFRYPEAILQVDTNSTLFPNSILPMRFFYDAELTDGEIAQIEKDTYRFHTWGTTTYRDAFGIARSTKFRMSFGGPDFALTTSNYRKGKLGADGKSPPGWTWVWENGHNEAT